MPASASSLSDCNTTEGRPVRDLTSLAQGSSVRIQRWRGSSTNHSRSIGQTTGARTTPTRPNAPADTANQDLTIGLPGSYKSTDSYTGARHQVSRADSHT